MNALVGPKSTKNLNTNKDAKLVTMNQPVKTKVKKKFSSLPDKPVGVPKYNNPRSAIRKPSATDSRSYISRAVSNRSQVTSAASTRSYLSSARSNASSVRKGKGQSRLDDFKEYDDSGGEDGVEENDVKFINIPSLREQTTGTGKQHAQPKQFIRLTHEYILETSQETEPSHVYEIQLSGKNIAEIQNLEKFHKVRVLDFSCNYIKSIDNLQTNQELRELKLYDNCISCIANLEKLKDLSSLQLQHNQIGTIGKGLQTLRNLKVLRLDNNQLTKLDVRELAPLGKLTSLDISSNRLDNISAVSCLSSLEELYCRNNRLRQVPDLSICKKLQEVDFSYNRLASLSGLKSLPNLTVINVSHNQLTTLKSLGKLKGLEELFAPFNRLTELGCVADFYPALQILDLSDNHIEHWDHMCSLSGFHELVELFVAGNPFSLEDGEKPRYIPEIQRLIPQLQVLDGGMLKKQASRSKTPLMRPMSASSIVSSRQVETQITHMKVEMDGFEENLSKRFDSLRELMSKLPDKPPTSQLTSPASSRPTSKCSKRSLIFQAQQFAANHFEDGNSHLQ